MFYSCLMMLHSLIQFFIWFVHFVLKEERRSSRTREPLTNVNVVLKRQMTHHIHRSPKGIVTANIKRIESGNHNQHRHKWNVGVKWAKNAKRTPKVHIYKMVFIVGQLEVSLCYMSTLLFLLSFLSFYWAYLVVVVVSD